MTKHSELNHNLRILQNIIITSMTFLSMHSGYLINEVTIPEVETIQKNTFRCCTSLRKVNIPFIGADI